MSMNAEQFQKKSIGVLATLSVTRSGGILLWVYFAHLIYLLFLNSKL
jgi:hypothetical protein